MAPPLQQAQEPPPFDTPAPAAVPAPTSREVDPAALTAALVNRDYHLGIGDCLGAAWRLLVANFWLIVGGTFVAMVAMIGIQMGPILGFVAAILLGQVFNSGLYYFCIKLNRGEVTTIGDAFSGFSRSFAQLVLLSLVYQILTWIIAMPVIIPIVGMILWNWEPTTMVPLAIVMSIPLIYLGVGWMFAGMLVIDRGLEFWDAMELSRKVVSKHWFKVFFLTILLALVIVVGVLAFFIGFFVAIPLVFGAMAIAYDIMFQEDGGDAA
jgi:hypothetical protein